MADKQMFRRQCLAVRRSLSEEKRRQKSAEIGAKLAQNGAFLGTKTVLSYLASPEEVDLTAFHDWAKTRGIRVAYPISERGGQMVAAIPDNETAIAPGLYGIRSPIRERSTVVDPAEIDVVIVPCVGFDRQGHRLGHGGGYYDRYLPRCTNACTILVAFAEQELAEVPVEAHDVTISEVITA